MHARTVSESELAARVTAFATMPKDDMDKRFLDVCCLYTGDGDELVEAMLNDLWQRDQMPNFFFTGLDNLMLLEGGKGTNASSLRSYFERWWRRRRSRNAIFEGHGKVYVDDTASGTHGQAVSLIQKCLEMRWRKVALFISGHRAVCALLTTIARIDMAIRDGGPREELEQLLVVPIPCYGLRFGQSNWKIETPPPPHDKHSGGWNWTKSGLDKVAEYQQTLEPNGQGGGAIRRPRFTSIRPAWSFLLSGDNK
jgi:hypothetical protein